MARALAILHSIGGEWNNEHMKMPRHPETSVIRHAKCPMTLRVHSRLLLRIELLYAVCTATATSVREELMWESSYVATASRSGPASCGDMPSTSSCAAEWASASEECNDVLRRGQMEVPACSVCVAVESGLRKRMEPDRAGHPSELRSRLIRPDPRDPLRRASGLKGASIEVRERR